MRTVAAHDGEEVVLRLPAPVLFTVIARGADGEPLPAGTHAGIQLWLGNHWVEHSAHDRVTFACEAGLTGTYGLKITAPGYLEFSKWPWKPPGPGGTAEIELRPAGRIVGTLRDANGRAVEYVEVLAVPTEGRRRPSSEAGKGGRFEIMGVGAGTYSLWVIHAHQATERIGVVEIAPGGVGDAGTLRVTATRPLEIVVTDRSGSRVIGANVTLFTGPGKLEEKGEVAVTGRDGTARIEVVPGAEAAVLIVKRGHGSVAFRVDSETHKAVTLPQPGEVHCVAQINDRKGPRSYSFALRHPRVGITWQPYSRARHIENGMEWTFADVAPGEVEALFHPAGETHARKVTVVAGQTAEVRFQWPP